ncbi:MAG: hypothetical protein LBD96_09690 [Treponema sp.]|jgi:hypothetical protein|nr:hypothetical protein [Treponema sp.]
MKKFFLSGVLFFVFFGIHLAYADDYEAKIKAFWDFVSENENDIVILNSRDSPVLYELFDKIQSIDKNIYVILDNRLENNKKNIIISCGGNRNYFTLCDRIVGAAPAYEHLNPVSLFPPLERIEPFTYGDIQLKTEDVRVCFDIADSNIELLFILNDEHTAILRTDNSGALYNAYMQMLFVMVQQILGERMAGEKIKSGGIIPVKVVLPSMPITEIREHIK